MPRGEASPLLRPSMIRIAPSGKDAAIDTLEKRLWAAADQLRANSGLTSAQYSQPVLGLIFLRFADARFSTRKTALEQAGTSSRRGSRANHPTAYRKVDRAHREWTPGQISFIANVVWLYRGEEPDFILGGQEARAKIQEVFSEVGRVTPCAPSGKGKRPAEDCEPYLNYRDVPGLCRAATLKEIEAQGWSLNPGRYVGVAPGEAVSDEDFKEQLETLNEELETLNAQARELEATIAKNVAEILET